MLLTVSKRSTMLTTSSSPHSRKVHCGQTNECSKAFFWKKQSVISGAKIKMDCPDCYQQQLQTYSTVTRWLELVSLAKVI